MCETGGSIPSNPFSHILALSLKRQKMLRTYCANTEKTQSKTVLLTSDGVGVRRLLSDVKEMIHQGE